MTKRKSRKCRDCGQPVYTPESRGRGYGPVCWRRRHPPPAKVAKPAQPAAVVRPELPGQVDVFELLAEIQ